MPVTSTKASSTMVATPGRRPDRNNEIAMSGPNSPTAPTAMMAVPNGVRISPASRSTGISVPSAVLVSATPMNTPAAADGASSTPRPTPTTREISQPSKDRLIDRPRIRSNSISSPARKNNIASPNWASDETNYVGCTQPSTEGPTSNPRTISKTTIGIFTTGANADASNGASAASSGIKINDVMWMVLIARPSGVGGVGRGAPRPTLVRDHVTGGVGRGRPPAHDQLSTRIGAPSSQARTSCTAPP